MHAYWSGSEAYDLRSDPVSPTGLPRTVGEPAGNAGVFAADSRRPPRDRATGGVDIGLWRRVQLAIAHLKETFRADCPDVTVVILCQRENEGMNASRCCALFWFTVIDDGVRAQGHGGAAHGTVEDPEHNVGCVEQPLRVGVHNSRGEHIKCCGRASSLQAMEIDGGGGDRRVQEDLPLRCRQSMCQHAHAQGNIGVCFVVGGCQHRCLTMEQRCPTARNHTAVLHSRQYFPRSFRLGAPQVVGRCCSNRRF